MTKLRPYIVNSFNEGITSELRGNYGFSQVAHFDAYSDRLVQQTTLESDSLAGNEIKNFVESSTNDIYGLIIGGASPGIVVKAGSGLPTVDGWGTPVTSAQDPEEDFLFEYKGDLYFMDEGDDLCYFRISNNTITNNFQTNLEKGVISGINSYTKPLLQIRSGYAFFFDAQNMYRLTDVAGTGTWSTAYTISDSYEISARTQIGTQIYLGITPKSDTDDCRVLLIDPNLDTNFVLDDLSLGKGKLKFLSVLDGVPTAIVSKQIRGRTKMSVMMYDGYKFVEIQKSSIYDFNVGGFYHEDGEKIYFGGKLDGDDTYSTQPFDFHEEARSVGIYSVDSKGVLRCEVLTYVVGEVDGGTKMAGLYNSGGYWFFAGDSSSVYKTNSTDVYTQESVLTTRILNFGEAFTKKQLSYVVVSHEPLITNVIIQYKVVGESSWTTMTTNTTDDTTRTTATFGADGTELPVFTEIMIRVLVNNLTTLTGLMVGANSYPDNVITQ